MMRLSAVFILAVIVISGLLKITPAVASPQQHTYAQMLNSGEIRMAIPYGRITYINSKGQILGFAPELSKYFSNFLLAKYKKKVLIKVVPSVPGRLLSAIDDGNADFALDYLKEFIPNKDSNRFLVYEHPRVEKYVIVSNQNQAKIINLLDLSGKTVCVDRFTQTTALDETNKELKKTKKDEIHIYQDRGVLSDEDLLQMVNGDLIDYIWVANWRAELWKPLLPNIVIHPDTAVTGGSPGDVIVTKMNADLAKDILDFAASPYLEAALRDYRQKTFSQERFALKSPLTQTELNRFESMKQYFYRYGHENQLDPLFLAGLGFQESLLNQNAVSSVGAIGVMQLMLETGKSMNTGNIYELEPNIHAGAKYINSLLQALSLESALSETERGFFAVAAYNSGANNVRKARELAIKMGLDPNQWFLNVEMASARLFGLETFQYVRNVYKYYVTYDVLIRKTTLAQEKLNPKR
ncbi:transglycosylase SLT domain-containing protein [Polynucleobacter sp. MWH-UH24A]|uniref:transglycosylase SLT domain-containing protein n=1 Tax=Polynucleobacter sp. MWH-UH24A TaxID=2689110 RepID=UPI001BFD0CE1|nr:transglycosylase SLT domain-containing protein [Polynucleobacter sp. MWH-UH24A]QWD75416.1 transglycosylase SLT domain-containing protein [Polynucleobacter sp. MWH-UH24A]